MKIGYARVSTDDQTLAMQEDALKAAGCSRVFSDTASGSKRDRAGLLEAMATIVKGDVLVVWKLDRLGRSTIDLLTMVKKMEEDGVGFRSLKDGIDTSTPSGKMFCGMLAVFAEFERDTICQRTKAGLAAARSRGRVGGRRRVTEPEVIRAKSAEWGGDHRRVCSELRISPCTYYRAMRGVA